MRTMRMYVSIKREMNNHMIKRTIFPALFILCVIFQAACITKIDNEIQREAAEQADTFQPCTGVRADYTFRYPTQSRDFEWESDIIDFAEHYLKYIHY